MKLLISKDYNELSKNAFEVFNNIVKDKKNPRVGLATGSSPLGLYNQIIENYINTSATYSNFEIFNLDEYIGLEDNNPNKYSAFLYENILDKANFDTTKIDLILNNEHSVEDECERYHKNLIGNPLDVQILGLGANCHIGFNEPGTSFDSTTHIVELQEKTRKDNARFFNSIDEVPTKAITVGIKDIMSADNIILVASGKDKAEAVRKMLKDEINNNCPASILRVHKSVTVIIDEDASQFL